MEMGQQKSVGVDAGDLLIVRAQRSAVDEQRSIRLGDGVGAARPADPCDVFIVARHSSPTFAR